VSSVVNISAFSFSAFQLFLFLPTHSHTHILSFPVPSISFSVFQLFSEGRAAASRRAADKEDEQENLKFCQRNAHVQFLFSISVFSISAFLF
jgi:hypothetical protein